MKSKLKFIDTGSYKTGMDEIQGLKDAPYFRTKYQPDIFEAEFKAKSIAGIKRAASKHIKALLKAMGE